MSPTGSEGKDHRRISSIHQDFDYIDTQPFDAASPLSGGDNEGQYFEDTVPFDDDYALDTELVNLADDTQALDFGGDTQALDFGGDTQALDFGGETQALDDADTQLLDEGFESDGTEVLENVDVDDGNDQSVDSKGEPSCEHGDGTGAVIAQGSGSGSMPPRYTFLRAESLRQAALATRNVASKQTQDENTSVMDMGQVTLAVNDNGVSFPRCSEKFREVEQENEHGKCSAELEGVKRAVRKLFKDDLPVEMNGPSLNGDDEGDGLDGFPVNHGDLAGLSYANSQEPGELSQNNALDFVDKFLNDNMMEFDQETNCVKNMEGKSRSIPITKGQQSLAKRVDDSGKAGRTGIYDWDDNIEDEGGGEIFLRRMGDFFKGEAHRPRSLPGFRKSKACRSNDDKDDEEHSSIIPNKRKVHSDSRLGILKPRDKAVREATRKLKRNLGHELDDQFNINCSRGEMDPNDNAGAQVMMDVGLDTQMAAEAMEALCNADDVVDPVTNDATHVTRSGLTYQKSSFGKVGKVSSKKELGPNERKREVDIKSKLQTSGIPKNNTKEVRLCKIDNMMTGSKRSKLTVEGNQISGASEDGRVSFSPIIEQRKSAGALKRHQHELNNPDGIDGGSGESLVKKKKLQNEVWQFTPNARRTRKSLAVNQMINVDIPSKSLREGDIGVGSLVKSSRIAQQASKAPISKSTARSSDHFEADGNSKLCQLEKLAPKASTVSVGNDPERDAFDPPRRRRSFRIRNLSNHDKESETLGGSSKPSIQPEDIEKSTSGKRKMRTEPVVKSRVSCRTHSSPYGGTGSDKANPGDNTNSFEHIISDESPRERNKSSDMDSSTPAKFKTSSNDASPVCMSDDYYKQSCNQNLSRSCLHKVFRKELHRELLSLTAIRPELVTPSKDSRKRKDMSDVRILYSHHLDDDIIKHQKKILARLGVSVASSIADATHFIADQFVRTRNMLEAIAFGKPVVTHLWIESCGQASCFIDERNYILRDAKKEKEFGFSMPVSLARAIQHPLLEGRRVLITSNTKPSKEIISSLVKAVNGQTVDRVSRSVLKDDKIPDDLLILSCEEDYGTCLPFLEKGAMVYSSELLLNGIVTQKLEYERHRLFADQVKKTRSTVWLKRDDRMFVRVTKCN